jgi:hypothetical protein
MACILSVQVSSEANNVAQASGSLHDGTAAARPLDGGTAIDVALATSIRIGREAPKVKGCVRELETRSSAEG